MDRGTFQPFNITTKTIQRQKKFFYVQYLKPNKNKKCLNLRNCSRSSRFFVICCRGYEPGICVGSMWLRIRIICRIHVVFVRCDLVCGEKKIFCSIRRLLSRTIQQWQHGLILTKTRCFLFSYDSDFRIQILLNLKLDPAGKPLKLYETW